MVKLSSNAEEIYQRRYAAKEDETWEEGCNRAGKSIAFFEADQAWADIFAEELYNMNFMCGGRILRNAGRPKQSILNCATLPIRDDIESIGETLKNSLILWKYGAGLGIPFSNLREGGAPLKTFGGVSSGMLSFMSGFDYMGKLIETGGQRRSGCLGLSQVSHPSILDFIDAKKKDGDLPYFNLSVAVNNSFLKAVEEDEYWDLQFAGRVTKTLKAREIWDRILYRMIKNGDPGLINFDNLVKNNTHYFQNIECTNLCGEIPMPAYGMCCLGSLVLPNFTSGKQTNWKKLEKSIEYAVRFLDNVLDINYYPIEQTKIATKDSRRIGLGVMGLHDYLMTKQIRYGSEKSLAEIEKLFRFIRNASYRASIKLAVEKGAFPKYSRYEYTHASFVKKLPPKIRMEIKKNGIRNSVLNSCPPTGTTSLLPEVSSGIEPVFALATKRTDRVSNRYYIHPKLVEFLESEDYKNKKEKPDWLVDVSDLKPTDHLEVQVACQKYVDNAISKTINCPSDITTEELSALLLEYIYDLKGITVYVDKSKKGQVLNRLTFEEAIKHINDAAAIAEEDVQCNRGTCEL